jgi:hypothetical protein
LIINCAALVPRTIVLYRLFLVGFVLGPATAKLAVAMTEYNPDSKWKRVEE